jgi:hypothetical protein
MAYTVKKGYENIRVGAKIFDGKKTFNGTLSEATQEELEQLFAFLPQYISKAKKVKRTKKKRDNDPDKQLPKPPVHEPTDTEKDV